MVQRQAFPLHRRRPEKASRVLQLLRIGKIPPQGWRQAHIESHAEYRALANNSNLHHDVADFTETMRQRILAANDQYFSVAGTNPNPLPPPGANWGSDESRDQVWAQADLVGHVLQIDHIIEYQDWGCNDFRNARVVSQRENNPGPISRPAGNAFRVISLDGVNDVNNTGVDVVRGGILSLLELRNLLAEADDKHTNHGAMYDPDHGVGNQLPNEGAMTDDDFEAIYYNLEQE